jgi:hypothetical protein
MGEEYPALPRPFPGRAIHQSRRRERNPLARSLSLSRSWGDDGGWGRAAHHLRRPGARPRSREPPPRYSPLPHVPSPAAVFSISQDLLRRNSPVPSGDDDGRRSGLTKVIPYTCSSAFSTHVLVLAVLNCCSRSRDVSTDSLLQFFVLLPAPDLQIFVLLQNYRSRIWCFALYHSSGEHILVKHM